MSLLRRKIILILLCAVFVGWGAQACAVTSVHTMSTTNYVDRKLVKNRAWSWPLLPVLIPTTIVTLAVDNFIIAPAANLPSAALDGWYILSEPVDGAGYYAEAGFAPFRLVLAPVVFVGSWLGRTFFAVRPKENAAWAWPEWGYQWRRDADGNLIGPPEEDPGKARPLTDPKMKKPPVVRERPETKKRPEGPRQ